MQDQNQKDREDPDWMRAHTPPIVAKKPADAGNPLGSRRTTVFARQGHHTRDSQQAALFPAAHVAIERIGDLLNHNLAALLEAARAEAKA